MPDPVIANRYQPLRVLGEGAMGQVLLARDLASGDEVALKVISPRVMLAEKTALQFRQEFRLMTQLRHPHCCAVYDYGLAEDGAPFFTMEVVPGHGLDELLPVGPERFRTLFAQLLLALGYLHQLGYVHLDIKSANVRVKPDGTLKLMDYGLMEYAGHGSGQIRGTLPYISPEMARRGPVDRRSDLYSAGVLAYELLTGKLPFVRRGAVELLRAHLEELPERPSRVAPGIPADLDRLVMRLLAKEPVERYQSADEVLADLGFEAPPGIGGSLLTSPMVGREEELARLEAGLAELVAGRPGGVVRVGGKPGIGKSRLLEEFRFRVQLAHVVFAGGSWQEHQHLPYAAITGALRALLPAMRQHVPAALEEAAPVLVRLVTELGAAPAPELENPKHEMVRLQAAVTRLLLALAERQPFVLALENAQWADVPSRELLAYLERNLHAAPLLLVVATQQQDERQELPLPELATIAVRRMVCNMLGSEAVEPAFTDAVAARSTHNPLFVERLLDHLVKAGALVRRAGRWNTELDLAAVDLPASLDALLNEKLVTLGPEAVLVGRVAAALGAPAGIDFLQAVSGLPDAALFAALAELQHGQVMAQGEHGAFGFVQHAYGQALYAALGPDERVGLHERVAAELLRGVGDRPLAALPMELVVAIATQTLHGDLQDHAIRYNLEAGRRAARLYALADADTFLTAGLLLIEASGDPRWDRTRFDYLQTLGDAKRASGLARDAVEHLGAAARLADSLGDVPGLGRLLTSLAAAAQMLSQLDEALALCERAVPACLAADDRAGAARALVRLGRIQFFQHRPDEARATAERALELAIASNDAGIMGLAYALAGFLLVTATPARGIDYLDSAVSLQQAVGDRSALNDAYNMLGNAHLALGNLAEARAAFAATEAISRENALREELVFAQVSLATTALEIGQHQEARALAAEARELAEAIGARFPLGMALVLEGLAALHAGEPALAEALTARGLALAHELQNKYLASVVLPRRLEALVELGRHAEAIAACAELPAEGGEVEGLAFAWQAAALLQAGSTPEAEAALARAAAIAERLGARTLTVLVGLLETKAAIAGEQWSAASAKAEAALALATAIGASGRAAELHGLLGEITLATGAPGATQHFTAMLAIATTLAAPLPRATALFGLAAADPYGSQAHARAAEAAALITHLAEALPPEPRATYLQLHRRLLEGNYVAFGLPRQRRAPTGRLPFGQF